MPKNAGKNRDLTLEHAAQSVVNDANTLLAACEEGRYQEEYLQALLELLWIAGRACQRAKLFIDGNTTEPFERNEWGYIGR